ncbi:hypothetical protein DRJ17_03620 [Candidatus Woesearchaeota archaeon]|nr:MAG: hypothetical protein DRJ17_03620 [Candidatus Woesearchaeota archaeon]
MINLFKIIKKNFKILLRSKTSALIVIFGPLLIIFLMGLAFNNANPFSIKIGIYSESYSNQTEEFLEAFRAENVNIVKFTDIEDCIEKIRDNDIHACVELPATLEVSNERKVELIYHVDSSNLILVDTIGNLISKTIMNKSSQQSISLTNILLSKLEETKSTIDAQNAQLSSLIESNNQLKVDLGKVITNLKSINTEFDPNAYNLSQIKEKSQSLTKAADSVVEDTLDMIEQLEDDVDDFCLNASEEQALLDDLNDTRTVVLVLQTELSNNNGSSLSRLVNNLNTGLNVVQSQFNNIENTRTEAISSLNKTIDSISSINNKISDIQKKLTNLKESIGQIKITRADVIVSPFTTKVNQIAAKETYLKKKMPSIIILVVMFIGILLATTLVMIEKKSPAHFRNYIVPTRDITFIIATYLTSLIIIALQLAIILGVSVTVFKLNFLNNWINICLILFVTTSLFIFLGMLIGYLFKSEETSVLAAISVGSLLFLLSDLLIPIESMPLYLYNFVKSYNPFIIGSELLKKSIIFIPPTPLKNMLNDVLLLVIYATVSLILVIIAHKLIRANYLGKLMIRRAIRIRRMKKVTKKEKEQLKKAQKEIKKENTKKMDGRTKAGKKAKAEKAISEYEKHAAGVYLKMK